LAELDVEEYGIGSVVVQGLKKHPYYTDLVTVPPVERISLDDRLMIEGRFQSLADGGHLLPLNLAPSGLDSKPLMELTERIRGSQVEFFTYTGIYSLCGNCHKWFLGVTPTCSSCGSNNVRYMGRSSAIMKPLSVWPNAKTRMLERVVQYSPP
jgi:anaerobic ribonucleoside-triphosphate reductase